LWRVLNRVGRKKEGKEGSAKKKKIPIGPHQSNSGQTFGGEPKKKTYRVGGEREAVGD